LIQGWWEPNPPEPISQMRAPLYARPMRGRIATILGFVLFLLGLAPARADEVADFYRGKELRLIIGASVGGGYDVYARAIAKHLSEHIPGNPIIVPQDMPAGGGIAAANSIYNVASRDGTVIGAIQNTVPFEPFFNNRQAQFDAERFGWLGTPESEVALYLVWHTSKIQSLKDAQTREMIAGGAGAASTPVFYGRIFNQILGLKARFVNGYPGQNEILLAMENGEVEAMTSPFWSSLQTARPEWIPKHLVRVLFQYGEKPLAELPGVPFALDLITNEADKTLLRAASAPLVLGRPFAAPPDVPPERLAALRSAMMATFRDPAFLADCVAQRLDCSAPKSGEELASLIRAAYAIPPDIRRRLIEIYQQGQGGQP